MSWAAHHPEVYEELVLTAITRKVQHALDTTFPDHAISEDQCRMMVETLYEQTRFRGALLDWAHPDIIHAEQDYWSRQADYAKTFYQDKQNHGL